LNERLKFCQRYCSKISTLLLHWTDLSVYWWKDRGKTLLNSSNSVVESYIQVSEKTQYEYYISIQFSRKRLW